MGKVNVPIKNWNDTHQMTLELITVAYNNRSAVFNEFETFPLQYHAMTDIDWQSDETTDDAINIVQERFLALAREKTCLKIIHSSDPSQLPPHCGGNFRTL